MSQSEVERFARDLKSSPALRAELAKDDRAETVVSMARRHSYGFTLDDLEAFAGARAGAAGREDSTRRPPSPSRAAVAHDAPGC